MLLQNAKWNGLGVTGWALCPHCRHVESYRKNTAGLRQRVARKAVAEELAKSHCPVCGKDEDGHVAVGPLGSNQQR